MCRSYRPCTPFQRSTYITVMCLSLRYDLFWPGVPWWWPSAPQLTLEPWGQYACLSYHSQPKEMPWRSGLLSWSNILFSPELVWGAPLRFLLSKKRQICLCIHQKACIFQGTQLYFLSFSSSPTLPTPPVSHHLKQHSLVCCVSRAWIFNIIPRQGGNQFDFLYSFESVLFCAMSGIFAWKNSGDGPCSPWKASSHLLMQFDIQVRCRDGNRNPRESGRNSY